MKNIVTVGGGTGSFTVLSGLKNLKNVSLRALVTMADDGGSTGVLRSELGVLPPGDVRQCLVALSFHSDIVRELMNYRFSDGTMKGHNFGNIFLAALEKVTGDFAEGVEVASEILRVKGKGKVIPVTKNKAKLVIKFADKTIMSGESNIDRADLRRKKIDKIFYKNTVRLNPHAEEAIMKANYIIIGPGNFYCSLVPNLIVGGFEKAVRKSKAKIILPVNLTNKEGHTNDWKVSDYVRGVEKYLGKKVNYILINTKKPSKEQVKFYKTQIKGEILVVDDIKMDPRVIRAPLLSTAFIRAHGADKVERSLIRHDSAKLAKCIEKIIKQ